MANSGNLNENKPSYILGASTCWICFLLYTFAIFPIVYEPIIESIKNNNDEDIVSAFIFSLLVTSIYFLGFLPMALRAYHYGNNADFLYIITGEKRPYGSPNKNIKTWVDIPKTPEVASSPWDNSDAETSKQKPIGRSKTTEDQKDLQPVTKKINSFESLFVRNDVYFKKSSNLPFTGDVMGEENGTLKNGKKEGLWIVKRENGNIKSKINYTNGLKNGLREEYNPNSRLAELCTYKNGVLHGRYESYNLNGKTKEKGKYINGEKAGQWITFDDIGNVKSKRTWK